MRRLLTAILMCQAGAIFAHGHHHHDHEHEPFQWTAVKSEYAEVELDRAGPGRIEHHTQVPARIAAHPDLTAIVAPKVEGNVVEIRKGIGEEVEKGEILAVIESQEIADAKTAYLVAKAESDYRTEQLNREASLRGISPGQDYFKAKRAAEAAELECECARQHLYALGLNDSDMQTNSRFYPLRAPFKGKVLTRQITLGEHADEGSETFRIGNFEQVWVEMQIAQEDARRLRQGQSVAVVSSTGKRGRVELAQFSPVIDEQTRRVTAIAVMDNASEKWKPGEYVTAEITTKKVERAIVVPREAVQKMKGKHYVFVECEDNFEACKVKLGKMDEEHVEIVSGIEEGCTYVSKNAFSLKADYEKEEVEHSH